MKILFCSSYPLSKQLGGPKVIMELVEGMEKIGWKCDLLGRTDICKETDSSNASLDIYSYNLSQYLQQHAMDYDVVDYDHHCLPFPRTQFSDKTLFVARSVLLAHHFETIPIPRGRGWRPKIRTLLKGKQERSERWHRTCNAQTTIEQADVVNVSNEADKQELIRRGVPDYKIVVIPYGISESRRPLFDAVSSSLPEKPIVAFVGTFDYRKGAQEFPSLVEQVIESVPEAGFELMGTAGMFQTEAQVLAHFPNRLHSRIQVIPRYIPEELPELLSTCSVGVFPSYIEGMPFGVLEMLAASVPVIAYDSPGPPMMLSVEHLVPQGNVTAMSKEVVALLHDETRLGFERSWAKQRSQEFSWNRIAQITSKLYRENYKKRVENSIFTS